MFCSNCGTLCSETDNYCYYCGQNLELQNQQQEEPNNDDLYSSESSYDDQFDEEATIRYYFSRGFEYNDIIKVLFKNHNLYIKSGNVKKLLTTMETFSVIFESTTSVFNVVSKAVLPLHIAEYVLNHQKIGLQRYQSFIDERINGPTSNWSPLKKYNLKTFKALLKPIKSKIGEKFVEMKEEKNLMSRFLFAARKRPELELEQCLGEYEFSVIPRSLFSTDGQPLHCTDKAKIMHLIEDMTGEGNEEISEIQQNSAIVMDGGW